MTARSHGYAAFTREEQEDARRGRPAASLQEWAAARDLEFHGRRALAGFRSALPDHPEYMHNLVRGVLPGGRFGILLHELLQTHFVRDAQIPGTFYGVRVTGPTSIARAARPDRTWLPFIGGHLESRRDEDETVAFGTTGAWAPCTTLAMPVPETVARLPRLRATVRSRACTIKGAGERDVGPFRLTVDGVPDEYIEASTKVCRPS